MLNFLFNSSVGFNRFDSFVIFFSAYFYGDKTLNFYTYCAAILIGFIVSAIIEFFVLDLFSKPV